VASLWVRHERTSFGSRRASSTLVRKRPWQTTCSRRTRSAAARSSWRDCKRRAHSSPFSRISAMPIVPLSIGSRGRRVGASSEARSIDAPSRELGAATSRDSGSGSNRRRTPSRSTAHRALDRLRGRHPGRHNGRRDSPPGHRGAHRGFELLMTFAAELRARCRGCRCPLPRPVMTGYAAINSPEPRVAQDRAFTPARDAARCCLGACLSAS
jgi:hypothetical protein